MRIYGFQCCGKKSNGFAGGFAAFPTSLTRVAIRRATGILRKEIPSITRKFAGKSASRDAIRSIMSNRALQATKIRQNRVVRGTIAKYGKPAKVAVGAAGIYGTGRLLRGFYNKLVESDSQAAGFSGFGFTLQAPIRRVASTMIPSRSSMMPVSQAAVQRRVQIGYGRSRLQSMNRGRNMDSISPRQLYSPTIANRQNPASRFNINSGGLTFGPNRLTHAQVQSQGYTGFTGHDWGR